MASTIRTPSQRVIEAPLEYVSSTASTQHQPRAAYVEDASDEDSYRVFGNFSHSTYSVDSNSRNGSAHYYTAPQTVATFSPHRRPAAPQEEPRTERNDRRPRLTYSSTRQGGWNTAPQAFNATQPRPVNPTITQEIHRDPGFEIRPAEPPWYGHNYMRPYGTGTYGRPWDYGPYYHEASHYPYDRWSGNPNAMYGYHNAPYIPSHGPRSYPYMDYGPTRPYSPPRNNIAPLGPAPTQPLFKHYPRPTLRTRTPQASNPQSPSQTSQDEEVISRAYRKASSVELYEPPIRDTENPFMPPAGRTDFQELLHEIQTNRNPEKVPLLIDPLGESGTDRVEQSPWLERKSYPKDSTACDLIIVKGLEHGPDETGRFSTRLNCEAGPPHQEVNRKPRLRWLHVKHPTLSFDLLEQLVTTCPNISLDILTVALASLKGARSKVSHGYDGHVFFEAGTATRHVGNFHSYGTKTDGTQTDPVVFLSSPYLALETLNSTETEDGSLSRIGPQPLLNSLYGYDAGQEREMQQVLKRVELKEPTEKLLHVRQMWLLIIGNDLVITMSNHNLQALLGETLALGDRTLNKDSENVTVSLRDHQNKSYHINIHRSSSYKEFLQQAVALSTDGTGNTDDYTTVTETNENMTADKWNEIMSSAINEDDLILILMPWTRQQHHWRRQPLALLPAAKVGSDSATSNAGALVLPEPRATEGFRHTVKELSGVSEWLDSVALTSQGGKGIQENSTVGSPAPSIEELESLRNDAERSNESARFLLAWPPKPDHVVAQSSQMVPIGFKDHEMTQQIPATQLESADQDEDNATDTPGEVSPWPYLTRLPDSTSQQALKYYKAWQDMIVPTSSPLGTRGSLSVNPGNSSSASSSEEVQSSTRIYGIQLPANEKRSPNSSLYLESWDSVSDGGAENLEDEYYDFTPSESSAHSQASIGASSSGPDNDFRRRLEANTGPQVRFFSERLDKDQDETIAPEAGVERGVETRDGSFQTSFFLWRPRVQEGNWTLDEARKIALRRLEAVHKGTKENLRGSLHDRAFRCSRSDFIRRQKFHLQRMPETLHDISRAGVDSTGSPIASEDDPSSSHRPTFANINTVTQERTEEQALLLINRRLLYDRPSWTAFADSDPSRGASVQVLTSTYDAYTMRQLFQLSKRLFSTFVHCADQQSESEVSMCYWGAVDCIFRQLQWHRSYKIKTPFVVHFSKEQVHKQRTTGKTESQPRCNECSQDILYNSAKSALEHIHEVHGQCEEKTERLHEDPCMVWLHQVTLRDPYSIKGDTLNQRTNLVEDFMIRVARILRGTLDLRALASKISKPRSRRDTSATRVGPTLPTSLIEAFQNIIQLFILRSYTLSLKNRMAQDNSTGASKSQAIQKGHDADARKLSALEKLETTAYKNVWAHLNAARQDMIMETDSTRRTFGSRVEPVGIELLAALLMGNAQNPALELSPLSQRPNVGANYLSIYQAYLANLRFQCYNRPRRRVFLDIHSFEEELTALAGLLDTQCELLDKYMYLASLSLSRSKAENRSTLFEIQRFEVQRQLANLQNQAQEIRVMQSKSAALKKQVIQAIDVLEENHGKAIRVFTIVTLFFLPLSFVSTFLGMNTTDVDGLRWDQSIFWITSLPLTAVVLALAILYGYKGDELTDWMQQEMTRARGWLRDRVPRHFGQQKQRRFPGRGFDGINKTGTLDTLG